MQKLDAATKSEAMIIITVPIAKDHNREGFELQVSRKQYPEKW